MFSVGLEVDFGRLRERAPTAVAVSHFSIVVPFLLGVVAALPLYARCAPAGIPFHSFAFFMGIALGVAARSLCWREFLEEARGWRKTPLGTTALACAAADDAT